MRFRRSILLAIVGIVLGGTYSANAANEFRVAWDEFYLGLDQRGGVGRFYTRRLGWQGDVHDATLEFSGKVVEIPTLLESVDSVLPQVEIEAVFPDLQLERPGVQGPVVTNFRFITFSEPFRQFGPTDAINFSNASTVLTNYADGALEFTIVDLAFQEQEFLFGLKLIDSPTVTFVMEKPVVYDEGVGLDGEPYIRYSVRGRGEIIGHYVPEPASFSALLVWLIQAVVWGGSKCRCGIGRRCGKPHISVVGGDYQHKPVIGRLDRVGIQVGV